MCRKKFSCLLIKVIILLGLQMSVPSVPEGMKLTADTLKDLKNVASLVAQEDVRMKKQFVSIS
jgi:hypothetical protein